MLKKYKNMLLEIIREKDFDPMMFTSSEMKVGSSPCLMIRVKESPLKFAVFEKNDDYHFFESRSVEFGPNMGKPASFSGFASNWEPIATIYQEFGQWLEFHVRNYLNELILPDLWQQIEDQKPLVTGTDLSEKEVAPFSDEQKERLRLSIDEFKIRIIETFDPSPDQIQAIANRLDYLSGALDRLNRIDWKSLALSTTLNIAFALALDTAKSKTLYNLFKQAFVKVIYLLQ